MTKSKIPRRDEINIYLMNRLNEMQSFCISEFGLPDTWRVRFKTSYAKRRIASWGGTKYEDNVLVPFISLALYEINTFEVLGYPEYENFASNTVIGSYKTNSWRRYLDGLLAHEIAHAVQHTVNESQVLQAGFQEINGPVADFDAGHGVFFKMLYGALRERFVNNKITIGNRGILIPYDFGKSKYQLSRVKKRS